MRELAPLIAILLEQMRRRLNALKVDLEGLGEEALAQLSRLVEELAGRWMPVLLALLVIVALIHLVLSGPGVVALAIGAALVLLLVTPAAPNPEGRARAHDRRLIVHYGACRLQDVSISDLQQYMGRVGPLVSKAIAGTVESLSRAEANA